MNSLDTIIKIYKEGRKIKWGLDGKVTVHNPSKPQGEIK